MARRSRGWLERAHQPGNRRVSRRPGPDARCSACLGHGGRGCGPGRRCRAGWPGRLPPRLATPGTRRQPAQRAGQQHAGQQRAGQQRASQQRVGQQRAGHLLADRAGRWPPSPATRHGAHASEQGRHARRRAGNATRTRQGSPRRPHPPLPGRRPRRHSAASPYLHTSNRLGDRSAEGEGKAALRGRPRRRLPHRRPGRPVTHLQGQPGSRRLACKLLLVTGGETCNQ